MELALLLYAASVADNLRLAFDAFSTVFFVLMLCLCAVVCFKSLSLTGPYQTDEISQHRLCRKLALVCFVGYVATTAVERLTPQRQDVYVMAGAYVALKAANSEVVQGAAQSALGSIEKWLDTELAKVAPTPAPGTHPVEKH